MFICFYYASRTALKKRNRRKHLWVLWTVTETPLGPVRGAASAAGCTQAQPGRGLNRRHLHTEHWARAANAPVWPRGTGIGGNGGFAELRDVRCTWMGTSEAAVPGVLLQPRACPRLVATIQVLWPAQHNWISPAVWMCPSHGWLSMPGMGAPSRLATAWLSLQSFGDITINQPKVLLPDRLLGPRDQTAEGTSELIQRQLEKKTLKDPQERSPSSCSCCPPPSQN